MEVLALSHSDEAKRHVLEAAFNWTQDLASRQKVLSSKSELERLEASAVHLEAKVLPQQISCKKKEDRPTSWFVDDVFADTL